MTPEEYVRVSDLFERAAALSRSDQILFLRTVEVDDAVASRVKAMLRWDEHSDTGLSAARFNLTMLEEALEYAPAHPVRIGRYEIVDVIGAGGMGVVYRARQSGPDRDVALKMMRSAVSTPSMRRRFELETQILARLKHPGVAQLYEAGTADVEGAPRPWFAMELVEGTPLLEFASDQELDTHQRVELAVQICRVVAAAHRQGVVHRDLKPANILVDHNGESKILDFGIACATSGECEISTRQTGIGELLGTLPYMSPEQVAGNPDAIDVRSDVYGLGVVVYELLTGQLPYRVRGAALHEAIQLITDCTPMPLSAIDRTLRGDLETIVLKSLEKQPNRRYSGADELADDLERSIRNEPVLARPASKVYQLRKFARRNRAVVVSVAVVVMALCTAVVVSTTFAVREAEQRANAERQARIAQAVNSFLNDDLLEMASPHKRGYADVSLREVVDRAAERIERKFANDPIAKIDILRTVGHTYSNLGEYEQADQQLSLAMAMSVEHLAEDDAMRENVQEQYAILLGRRGRYDDAVNLARRTAESSEASRGIDHVRTIRAWRTVATATLQQGDIEETKRIVDRVLPVARKLEGDGQRYVIALRDIEADVKLRQQLFEEAHTLSSALLADVQRDQGVAHPATLDALGTMASAARGLGRLDESLELYWQTAQISESAYGHRHPKTLAALDNVALLHRELHHMDNAERLFREVLRARRGSLGEHHADTVATLSKLGSLLMATNRLEEAEAMLREVLEWRVMNLDVDATQTLQSRNNLATALVQMERYDEALPLLHESIAGLERTRGSGHTSTLGARYNLAGLYERLHRYDEALLLYERLVADGRRSLPEGHWHLGAYLGGLGRCLVNARQHALAEEALAEARSLFAAVFNEPNQWTRSIDESFQMLRDAQSQAAAN